MPPHTKIKVTDILSEIDRLLITNLELKMKYAQTRLEYTKYKREIAAIIKEAISNYKENAS